MHPKIISERLGLNRVDITLDNFFHVVPGLQETAVDQFANELFRKKTLVRISLEVFISQQIHQLNNQKY
ncbi:hypothetical protein COO17_24365 [Bacillus wiedmannii]|uniref:Uncharacterized protein n=1 Tax=Bacillus wiedmannii TaxID=1890302 RepID=A0A2B5NV23_9BACI|nr:hypothetical protein COO17_24365 [Bacillus wiedmannii]PFZ89852.1 hypothetical protein COL83_20925 [Bacillus wiedmannii]